MKLIEIITERSFSYLLAGLNDDILCGKCKSDIINYCGEQLQPIVKYIVDNSNIKPKEEDHK